MWCVFHSKQSNDLCRADNVILSFCRLLKGITKLLGIKMWPLIVTYRQNILVYIYIYIYIYTHTHTHTNTHTHTHTHIYLYTDHVYILNNKQLCTSMVLITRVLLNNYIIFQLWAIWCYIEHKYYLLAKARLKWNIYFVLLIPCFTTRKWLY